MPRRWEMRRWPWLLAACVVVVSGIGIAIFAQGGKPAASSPPPAAPTASNASSERLGVGCLGRIEPGDGIVRVAAPYVAGRPPLVRSLKVREGDMVRKGQLLAELDSRAELEVALRQNVARVAVARSRLAQVKAGPKAADVAAQQAEIAQTEARLEHARDELRRFTQLRQTDDVTQSELAAKENAVRVLEHAVEASRDRLRSLSEVRASDVAVAQAELDAATADAERARAILKSTRVHSPVEGRVLKIRVQTGEQAGPDGLLDLAESNRMYAVAEVYENDIARVRVGQKAVVSGDLLPQPVTGVVERIASEVSKLSVLPDEAIQFTEGRVFRVRIKLDNPELVAGRIRAKVMVRIGP